jgi:hypothetical protein
VATLPTSCLKKQTGKNYVIALLKNNHIQDSKGMIYTSFIWYKKKLIWQR